ncbi:MAG: hydroxyacid dehydrogenase [Tepidisphaeraceae bacterium]
MRKPCGLIVLDRSALELIYGPTELAEIAERVELLAPPMTRQRLAAHPDLLAKAEVLFSGWGAPHLSQSFLDATPKLKVVFYGAGAIGYFATDAMWDRGVRVTSAYQANAVPVAEYALAMILLSLKHTWRLVRETLETCSFPERNAAPGAYGSVVGLVSMGATARQLRRMLQPFDLKVLVYDPFLTEAEASLLNVERVSLEALFVQSDVVSLHTPDLAETEGMIGGQLLRLMKPNATFMNTARGAVVRQNELIEVLRERADLQAILDVTEPEPPAPDSPLYTMKNVLLTPHIAGSVGQECRRMGRLMIEELDRYLRGEPLKYQITREAAVRSSHRPVTAHVKPSHRPAEAAPVSPVG